ncbi:MAG: ATP-binding protein [Hyphomicrobiaceae bacterium]|nr:ATP-binding protein [Hyphomicrobiaceae bacterium]
MSPDEEKTKTNRVSAGPRTRHNAVYRWVVRHITEANGLSGKLLLLTILFVMLAEILTFVPSVANFRRNWLQERLTAAQIAALSAEAAPNRQVPKKLRDELLRTARVHAVALKRNNTRYLVLQAEMPERVDDHYDLRKTGWFELIKDALMVFVADDNRTILIQGRPSFSGGDFIEVVIDEKPLKKAMWQFAWNIALLSLLISTFTAALVYFALRALLVKPMQKLTNNMVSFSKHPEDRRQIIKPCARNDEIGTAERVLADMQKQLSGTLRQKNHLAALGLAVSKINHDLRNILANAQLISDRLGTIEDPTVQRLTPRLIGSLDRAIRLCSDTLHYGRAKENLPQPQQFALLPLVNEIALSIGLPVEGEIDWQTDIETDLQVYADHDQLYRVLANLIRNARQALDDYRLAQPFDRPLDFICVTASQQDGQTLIKIADSGPGIPAKASEHLFDAFQGSTRPQGSGLGLAIANEIIRAHGGTIELEAVSLAKESTAFIIKLPST